jgi:DNA-binding CsgD family transcriptional regulator
MKAETNRNAEPQADVLGMDERATQFDLAVKRLAGQIDDLEHDFADVRRDDPHKVIGSYITLSALTASRAHRIARSPFPNEGYLEEPLALSPNHTLTDRELEVLALLSEGKSNGVIASSMSLTGHAVKFHLTNIYQKLGVSNRTEAVSRFAMIKENALTPDEQLKANEAWFFNTLARILGTISQTQSDEVTLHRDFFEGFGSIPSGTDMQQASASPEVISFKAEDRARLISLIEGKYLGVPLDILGRESLMRDLFPTINFNFKGNRAVLISMMGTKIMKRELESASITHKRVKADQLYEDPPRKRSEVIWIFELEEASEA